MTRTTSILCCFLAVQPAFATTLGPGSEVPATFALIELCNEKHPEYKKQNTTAFSDWLSRNQVAVKNVQNRKEFRKEVEILKNYFSPRTPEHLKGFEEGCKNLSTELYKPEFDISDQSTPKPDSP